MSYNRDKNKGIVQFQMVEIRRGMMCVFIYFSFLNLTSLPSPAENQASSPLLGLHSGLPPVSHGTLLLLLLLSRFSHVRLCATPQTAAHQAPLSLGFSRQEYWSGLPCPPPAELLNSGTEPTSLQVSCIGRQVLYYQCHLESPMSMNQFDSHHSPMWYRL